MAALESRRHRLAAQADQHAAAPGGLADEGRAARAVPVSLLLLAQIRVQLVARFACLHDRLLPLGVVEGKKVAAFDRVAEEVAQITDLELRWNVGDEALRTAAASGLWNSCCGAQRQRPAGAARAGQG